MEDSGNGDHVRQREQGKKRVDRGEGEPSDTRHAARRIPDCEYRRSDNALQVESLAESSSSGEKRRRPLESPITQERVPPKASADATRTEAARLCEKHLGAGLWVRASRDESSEGK